MDLNEYLEGAQRVLRLNGGRVTASRLETLTLIYKAKKPLSAIDIEQRLNKRLDKSVDRATVFRMLNAFADLGLVHRLDDQSAYIPCKHFECSHGYHVVLSCEQCGTFQEVEMPLYIFEDSKQFCEKHFDFELSNKHIRLEGTCMACGGRSGKPTTKPG